MKIQVAKPTAREIRIAVICLAIALGGVFIAARVTTDQKVFNFNLFPPCANPDDTKRFPCKDDIPVPDVYPEQQFKLQATFFTAWAALILVTPALCFFWFRRESATASKYWLAFWTVSFIAFLVHLCWAVFVLFAADKARLFNKEMNGGRVSEPGWDMVAVILWGIDVLLAWLITSENKFIRIPRVLLHLAVFGFFFVGSAIEGEKTLSKWLGYAMAAVVLASLIVWVVGRLKNWKTKAVPAAAG